MKDDSLNHQTGASALRLAKPDPLTAGSSDHFDSVAQKRLPLGSELQLALNLIPAHTWYAAPSGALTFLNERGSDYLGLPNDHPIRLGIDTGAAWNSHIPFLHQDDREETRTVWSECLRTGCAGEVSFRVRNADVGYCWFLSRAEPVRDADGTLLYWIGINLDIEERKRAEQELRDIVDPIPAIVWLALHDGSNTYVNSRFVEYSGMTPAQTAGSAWQDAVHPDDLQRHEAKWRASVASGEPHESEVRFRGADGEYRWHLDRGFPLRAEDGNIIKWYGIVTDIEDRKRVEEALRRNEHCLAEAQRLSHVGSVGTEVSTKRIFWSEESARIYGYAPVTEPTPELILQRVHPARRSLYAPSSFVRRRIRLAKCSAELSWRLLRLYVKSLISSASRMRSMNITSWVVSRTFPLGRYLACGSERLPSSPSPNHGISPAGGWATFTVTRVSCLLSTKPINIFYVCSPTPLQRALSEVLMIDPRYYTNIRESFTVKRRSAVQALEDVGFEVYDSGSAFYVWARIPEGFEDAMQLNEILIDRAGVAGVPGSAFADGDQWDNYMRLCIAREDGVLQGAFDRLQRALMRTSRR